VRFSLGLAEAALSLAGSSLPLSRRPVFSPCPAALFFPPPCRRSPSSALPMYFLLPEEGRRSPKGCFAPESFGHPGLFFGRTARASLFSSMARRQGGWCLGHLLLDGFPRVSPRTWGPFCSCPSCVRAQAILCVPVMLSRSVLFPQASLPVARVSF